MSRISAQQKAEIEEVFGRHINRGQVAYLKAGHLDVQEVERRGVHFTDAGADVVARAFASAIAEIETDADEAGSTAPAGAADREPTG